MNSPVISLTPKLESLPIRQVYRYMGMSPDAADPALQALVEACLPQFLLAAHPRACYTQVCISECSQGLDFGVFQVESDGLRRNLSGCNRAILFAATLGAQVDQQRRTAAVSSPTKALILDAMGTAGIEAVCDGLCSEFAGLYPDQKLRPRFSPGYGDLSLEFQITLLSVLDSSRKAGISLSNSLLMIPQKSVSAIVGIGPLGCTQHSASCEICDKKDCEYRL